MSGDTHAAAGAAVGLALCVSLPAIAVGSTSQMICCVGAAVIGALCPDLDVDKSKGNKIMDKALLIGIPAAVLLYFIMKRTGRSLSSINVDAEQIVMLLLFLGLCLFFRTRPHREASHSLLMMAVTTLCVYSFAGSNLWLWFGSGYLSHLLLDYFNTKGESLIWPMPGKFCLGLVTASGTADKVVKYACYLAVALLLVKGVLG